MGLATCTLWSVNVKTQGQGYYLRAMGPLEALKYRR